MSLRIMVGSQSDIKLGAVRQACLQLGLDAEVIGVNTRSVIQEQPFGVSMTMKGASYRAGQVAFGDSEIDVGIGIENGLERVGDRTVDFAIVFVVAVRNGIPQWTDCVRSEGVVFPEWAVVESETSGFEKTAGKFLAERHSECNHADPHSFLTDGKKTRVDLLTAALVRALRPLAE